MENNENIQKNIQDKSCENKTKKDEKGQKSINLSKKLIRQFAKANSEYEMVKDRDCVLVGLSGGKDSLALTHLLKRLQKIAPYDFKLKAVSLSYGMGEDFSYLKRHCAEFGIDYEVINSNIYEISGEKIRPNSSFCSFFSRMRRGYLYTYAKENGFNKLALGHHLDDAVESFFMNFTHNGALRTLAPKYKAECGVEVIRPLIFVRERQLRDNALINELETIGDEACPAMRFDVKMPHARYETKMLLKSLERENPKLFTSLLNAFNNIHFDTFFQHNLSK